ncbi:zinc finger protein ZXDC-like [Acanthaster planci]|uniref:Zinc finger protein ZXDC-like n=1 Tax=Acanthaster planci TaxID=133434 RepID=A0A8B7ZD81_ACAPL|nr:zinc finger protein ZXDC-like [Acanthaster planci]
MNGNPIFGDQGPLPIFNHLTNSCAETLVSKGLEISPDLGETIQNQETYPVLLVGETGETLRIQDGGTEGNEEGKVAHNLQAAPKNSSGDQLSDDILLFVRSESVDNSPHTSVNVSLEPSYLGSPNSAILPLEGGLPREQGSVNPSDQRLDGIDSSELVQNPEVNATIALPPVATVQSDSVSSRTSKSHSQIIDALNLSSSKMISIGSEASSSQPRLAITGGTSVLDMGNSPVYSVQDLNLGRLTESLQGAQVQNTAVVMGGEVNIPQAEILSSVPVVSNTGQLELSVATLPAVGMAGTTALGNVGQPVMYIITSRDRNTGATQRFRVTVDAESVATAPIGNLSLNTGLPALQIGSHWVVQQQPDAGVSGRLLSSDGASAAVDGSGDNTAVGVINTQVVPSIETQTTSDATAFVKANLGSGDVEAHFSGFILKPNAKEEKVFCCTFEGCREIFTTKKKLKLHQLVHADDRPHKCTVEGCDWTFPTLYKLRRHLAGHTGARPFTCEDCKAQFSTIYNLNMHKKRHERPDAFVCEVKGCEQIFPTMSKLTNHLRTHFPERRIKCKYPGCDKSFTTTCGMGSHYRIHDRDETIFPCLVEGCNKVYNKACRLKLHMRSHTGERPFKCTAEGCSWAFTCIQKLKRHMVQHTGDRQYECNRPGCHKLFTRLEHLKTHIKTHTGEKPFTCPEKDCDARFASRSSLFMHVKRHKQGCTAKQKTIFNCPMDECNQSYTTKDGLKKHILTVHSIMLPSASNESELVYIPTENPQAMVDAMTDPGLLQSPTVVRITQASASDSSPTNQLSVNPLNKDGTTSSANQNQPGGLVPYTSGAGLIVDSNGSPVSFVNSPTTQASLSWSSRGLHHENWSGSARTDFMYMQGGKKGKLTRNSESCESETDGALTSSYIPSSFSMTTTASLTLRDPATGARYVQTQLLQDDPPDESELTFPLTSHPTTSESSTSDLNVSTILPAADPNSHAQCPTSSSVDFLQTDREMESSIDGFRESTINLQDLE